VLLIPVRKNWTGYTPRNVQVRVIPRNPPLIRRLIKIAALIEKLRGLAEGDKAVRKTPRNVNLILSLQGKDDANPLPKPRGAYANVDSDVQHRSFNDAAKLGLRASQLVVQAPQYTSRRSRMIVLNPVIRYTDIGKLHPMVAFHEKPSAIPKDPGLNQINSGYGRFEALQFHASPWFSNRTGDSLVS
jgi:hypothetical protein